MVSMHGYNNRCGYIKWFRHHPFSSDMQYTQEWWDSLTAAEKEAIRTLVMINQVKHQVLSQWRKRKRIESDHDSVEDDDDDCDDDDFSRPSSPASSNEHDFVTPLKDWQ